MGGAGGGDVLCYNAYTADVWAVGCTLYALLHGRVPFDNHSSDALFDSIIAGSIVMGAHVEASAAGVIELLLTCDPNERPASHDLGTLLNTW